jgi:hypothetical protein
MVKHRKLTVDDSERPELHKISGLSTYQVKDD